MASPTNHPHHRYLIIATILLGHITRASVLSANIGDTTLFRTGHSWLYRTHTTVHMGDRHHQSEDGGAKPVRMRVHSDVLVESIWGADQSEYERLLRITLIDPTVMAYSKATMDLARHKSRLDDAENKPFYIYWNKGKVEKLMFARGEKTFLKNLKKGFASLLQFQLLDMEINETDASGNCKISYTSQSRTKFSKTKHTCTSADFQSHQNPEPLLSSRLRSTMETIYEMDELMKYIKTIEDKETHVMYLSVEEDVGNVVRSEQRVVFVEEGRCDVVKGTSADVLVERDDLVEEELLTRRDGDGVKGMSFVKAVGENRDGLQGGRLGTVMSANSLIRLIAIGRRSRVEDIGKSLSSKKNVKILHQIYDILGYVQTKAAHEAVMKKVHFDDETHEEYSERYLWACSFATQPHVQIMNDLLHRYTTNANIKHKIKHTLITSIASMAHRLKKLPQNSERNQMHRNVEQTIINELNTAQDRPNLLHALYNLKSQTTIPTLLNITQTTAHKQSVLAWKALYALPKQFINRDITRCAFRTFLQLDKLHDSSARTLAADILLENKPTDSTLTAILRFLASPDKAFEVKQYVWQRVRMLADECAEFKGRVEGVLAANPALCNYDVLGGRGLSTALRRSFAQTRWSNGSLMTLQEVYGGIVKRGVVNVEMNKDGDNQEIFSLGGFSGGLGGLFSSGDDLDDAQEEWNAGMQLSILGTMIRPFIFFQGQGDLMGHIWSGTASDMTNAFQALLMLHDDQQYIRLSSGMIVDIDVKGAISFDLSGKVEFSLWNRNSYSFIEKSAGISVIGRMFLDANFATCRSEFAISVAPKLYHKTDIDFSNGIYLCMRLTQPNTIIKYDVSKTQTITDSKYNIRRFKSRSVEFAGKTYALNKKNTDMCNIINLTVKELQ